MGSQVASFLPPRDVAKCGGGGPRLLSRRDYWRGGGGRGGATAVVGKDGSMRDQGMQRPYRDQRAQLTQK